MIKNIGIKSRELIELYLGKKDTFISICSSKRKLEK
jgi:hypothetical protein